MGNTDKERAYLTSLYPGYSWHEKVANMSSEQVIAVYLRFKRDGPPQIEPQLNPSPITPEEVPELAKELKKQDDQFRLF
jgi:hypothetical protein